MCSMGMRVLGYIRAFWVGSDGDAGVEDLGGCIFLRRVHSCGSTNR